MVKPVKVSDKNKPWNQRDLTRKPEQFPERESFLIVCEGERTEPNYFKALANILPPNVAKVEIEGLGKNTLSLVEAAIEIRERYSNKRITFDHVWVVFDKDSFPDSDFDNAIHKAESKDISVAWSNQAFELWYILHFENRTTPMSREDYSKKLGHRLKQPYHKNSEDMYYLLQKAGNEIIAIQHAKQLEEDSEEKPNSKSNPCTTVYKLVDKLNEFKKK